MRVMVMLVKGAAPHGTTTGRSFTASLVGGDACAKTPVLCPSPANLCGGGGVRLTIVVGSCPCRLACLCGRRDPAAASRGGDAGPAPCVAQENAGRGGRAAPAGGDLLAAETAGQVRTVYYAAVCWCCTALGPCWLRFCVGVCVASSQLGSVAALYVTACCACCGTQNHHRHQTQPQTHTRLDVLIFNGLVMLLSPHRPTFDVIMKTLERSCAVPPQQQQQSQQQGAPGQDPPNQQQQEAPMPGSSQGAVHGAVVYSPVVIERKPSRAEPMSWSEISYGGAKHDGGWS